MPSTSAELVYGTLLRLPGDFFSKPTVEDTSSFLSRLRHSMQDQQFASTRWHGSHDTYLLPDLHTASHIMSMSHVTITSHLLHDPTSDPTGFSEDQASISPLTLVGKEKNFQSGPLETCQAGEQSSTYGQQVFRVPTPSRPANSSIRPHSLHHDTQKQMPRIT